MYRLNITNDRLPIPCFTGYWIDKQGVITDSDKRTITISQFESLTGLGVKDPMILSLIAYHGLKWPFNYWKHLVIRKPENSANIEDMVLGVDYHVEDLGHPGFYLIPYFSNYVVNKRGIILNLFTKTFVQASKTNNGYWTVRLKSDDNRVSNRLSHRIVAMAFVPYSYDFQTLEVNHLNGDTLDDSYGNLEWASRESNLNHAVAHGLFKKRNPHKQTSCKITNTIVKNLLDSSNVEIRLRDVTTGHVFIFDNLVSASQQLGLGIRGIKYALDANDGRVIKGYQVKYCSDTSEWLEPTYSRARNYEVIFSDGTTRICNAVEAAKYCGVTTSSLQRLIREGRNKGATDVLVKRIGTGNVLC